MNVTPLRLSLLRFLLKHPDGYTAKGLVQELCPRDTPAGAWTEQGAARMAGKLVKPLREAGLISDQQHASMYRRRVAISEAGKAFLADHEAAASRTELEKALSSGTWSSLTDDLTRASSGQGRRQHSVRRRSMTWLPVHVDSGDRLKLLQIRIR